MPLVKGYSCIFFNSLCTSWMMYDFQYNHCIRPIISIYMKTGRHEVYINIVITASWSDNITRISSKLRIKTVCILFWCSCEHFDTKSTKIIYFYYIILMSSFNNYSKILIVIIVADAEFTWCTTKTSYILCLGTMYINIESYIIRATL